jgi:hypothetical protein
MALAFMSTATCIAAIMEMPEQSHHACAGMNQNEGPSDSSDLRMDCCDVQSADLARLTTTVQAVTELASAVSTPSVFEPTPAPDFPGAALDPDIPKPSSSPTYLLVSVFRL